MKKSNEILYSENQPFYNISIPMTIFIVACLVIIIYFNFKEELLVITLFFIILSFLTIMSLFYNMNTTIYSDRIEIKFGIGLVKKTIPTSNIDSESLTEYKSKRSQGAGIRKIRGGNLYNVKAGEAIQFKTSKMRYAIGTANYEEMYKVLKELKVK